MVNMTKKLDKEPRYLRRDWRVESIPYKIDTLYLPQFVKVLDLNEEQSFLVRTALMQLAEDFGAIVRSAAQEAIKNALSSAANIGLNQAIETVLGEEYRQMVESRNKKWKEREQTRQKEAKQEQKERKLREIAPTIEQLAATLGKEVRMMAYYRSTYHNTRARIQTLIDTHGKEVVAHWIKGQIDMPDAFVGEFDLDAYIRALADADIEEVQRKRGEVKTPADDIADFFDKHSVFEENEDG